MYCRFMLGLFTFVDIDVDFIVGHNWYDCTFCTYSMYMYINSIRGCLGIYYMYVVVGFTFMYKMYAKCSRQHTSILEYNHLVSKTL